MKYNDEEKTLMEKAFDVFVRLAAGFSVSTIIATLFMVFASCELNAFLVVMSLLLGTPTTYIGLTAMRNAIHKKYVRDMHMFEQLQRGMEEFVEDKNVEHKEVTENMAVFYSFIERKDTEEKISEDSYNAINSFLFMVNENYYEKIAVDSYKNLSRTTLIEMITSIIVSEIREGEKFDEAVAEDVINRAFFISESVKKEMIKEFSESKTKLFTKEPLYQIISSKVSMKSIQDILDNPEPNNNPRRDGNFNIRKAKHYKYMLQDMNEHEDNSYGDLFQAEWDFETFKEVICMIDDLYSLQLSELYEGYDIKKLAASLLYETAVYSVLNKKKTVGMQEILNTMKNWHYLDYEDKLVIIESFYNEFEGMEEIIHPFLDRVPSKKQEEKPVCKIIQFPGTTPKK